MATPKASVDAILAALQTFDLDFRQSPLWLHWEQRASQWYAIKYNGQLYPPKKIVSLATGMAVSDFSGGSPTNGLLQRQGFTIIRLEHSHTSQVLTPMPKFVAGHVYDRRSEITGVYGGSPQGGIAPSKKTRSIFLFTGDTGAQYGYRDYRDELGFFWYFGEGQLNDMQMLRGNRAIRDHAQNGYTLHLFKTLGKGEGQEYLGEHAYAGYRVERLPDKAGVERDAIIFRLALVGLILDMASGAHDEDADGYQSPPTLAEARARALAALVGDWDATGRAALRNLYNRSRRVRDYVLLRAGGICELCEEPAPFARADGTAYLEPHHTMRLSDGGLDHPRSVAAICPNCHRHIHYGIEGDSLNISLSRKILLKEGDGEK